MQKKKKIKKLKPWISQGLIVSIQERDKMKEKLQRNPNNLFERNKYKLYRNTINKLIRKTKNEYYKQKFREVEKDIKKTWDLINESTNDNREKNTNIMQIKIENEKIITDNLEICNQFVNYFSDIGQKLAESIVNKYTADNIHENTNKKVTNTIFLSPVSENELINTINSLKNGSAPGHDALMVQTIKSTMLYILKPLHHIINLIFSQGKFPSILKKSIIKPILKGGNVTNVSNYRPISLISNIAKIIEKCLKKRLLDHLNKNNVISSSQYGFREGLSTVDAIHALVSHIHLSLNNDRKPLAVFLDLAKAFDTVSHEKLINKLDNYGIRGVCSELIRDYLNDRRQVVSIKSDNSEEKIITYGVPQGTVLGPILFQIYINDMLQLDIPGKIISYADDTVLVFNDISWEEVKLKAEIGLWQIKNWLNNNLLTLNETKTKFITFSLNSSGKSNLNNIICHNCKEPTRCGNCQDFIENAENIKYLGIHLDQFLKWDTHIDILTGKLRRLLHKFYQLKQILKIQQLINVYKALVESLLTYGIIIWGCAYGTALSGLNIVQKHILKIILGKPKRYSTSKVYEESNVLDVEGLFILNTINYIQKNPKFLNKINHIHQTRANINHNLTTPKPKKTSYLKFIDYIGVKLYNNLPNKIKEIKRYALFKSESKMYVSNNIETFKKILHR